MKLKLLCLLAVATLNLNAATIIIQIDPPKGKISGYYLDTITESGVSVSENIGFVKNHRKENLLEGKRYEFWVTPYILTSQGIKIFGEPSDHIVYISKLKPADKIPNKPKIRIKYD